MNERLLQFIWQFRYFSQTELKTTSGDPLHIISTGEWNTHQGPDFHHARIRLGDTTWVGDVELHVLASDWHRHGHQSDERYQKLILHVVWQADVALHDQNGQPLPTLELHQRVSHLMLDQYTQWMHTQEAIPCQMQLSGVPPLVWQSWTDRLATERLQQKTAHIRQLLNQTGNHWEEVCWRILCRYFGGKTNGQSFEQVAASLPFTVVGRHRNQLNQLEALLLGQAGLLHKGFSEDYPQMLYREYQYLQKKYKLRVVNKPPVFLRMRPSAFPTLRLAQLAALLHRNPQIMGSLVSASSLREASKMLDATANDYWHYHFKLDCPVAFSEKRVGDQLIQTLVVNAVVPLLFTYGKMQGLPALCEKAMQWLGELPAEKNSLIQPFVQSGVRFSNAQQTQAALELRLSYCDARRCLECAVGNAILKQPLKGQQQVAGD